MIWNLSYKYRNLLQNSSIGGGVVLCRQRPWSRIAEAVVVVMGCACVLGPPSPLKNVKSREQDPVHSAGSEHHSSVFRGFGCLSLAAQTKERWQFLSVREGAPCKMQPGGMAIAQGWSQVRGAGKRNLCVCPPAPYPQLWSACSA